jgi:hypothetical protein
MSAKGVGCCGPGFEDEGWRGWFWGVSLWVGWFGADEGGGSRFRRMRIRRDWFML